MQVEARDHGIPSLTATANVTVVVADVDDIVPRFVARSYTFVTPENQVPDSHKILVDNLETFLHIRPSYRPYAPQVYNFVHLYIRQAETLAFLIHNINILKFTTFSLLISPPITPPNAP